MLQAGISLGLVLSKQLAMGFINEISPHLKGAVSIRRRISIGISKNFSAKSEVPKQGAREKTESTIPRNIEEFQASQKATFSPLRSRETTSARLASRNAQQCGRVFSSSFMTNQGAQEQKMSPPSDSHIDVYDCNNAVSLSSVVQGNVPQPYKMDENTSPSQYNMQGGLFCQSDKYLSGDLNDNHHSTASLKGQKGMDFRALHWNFFSWSCNQFALIPYFSHTNIRSAPTKSFNVNHTSTLNSSVKLHTHASKWAAANSNKLTQKQRLKQTMRDYGLTVVVFHVTISLASLGVCYLLVSSGVEVLGLLDTLGINRSSFEASLPSSIENSQPSDPEVSANAIEDSSLKSQVQLMAMGVSTFVVAYAIHKVFAPLRIGITLVATPIIVRYLRQIGFLKVPKS